MKSIKKLKKKLNTTSPYRRSAIIQRREEKE